MQKELINSFTNQPIIIVFRLSDSELNCKDSINKTLINIQQLNKIGAKHIEIAWSNNLSWYNLMSEIKLSFPNVQLGAASINTKRALNSVIDLKLRYSMSPIFDIRLQKKAREKKQILIPGVFSPSEINQCINFGSRLVKIFPASVLGVDFIRQIQKPLGSQLFAIAAGGMKVNDMSEWMKAGYGSIAIGRKSIKDDVIDRDLINWFNKN